MLRQRRRILVLLAASLVTIVAIGAMQGSALAESDVLRELTVYNQDFAVVSQESAVTLNPGVNRVEWPNLPLDADDTSFQVDWGSNTSGLRVWEQNYVQGLRSQYEILMANLGRQIVLGLDGGREVRGILRSAESGQILVETNTDLVSVSLDKISEVHSIQPELTLPLTPVFTAKVYSDLAKAVTVPAKISYTTRGLGWQGDYRLAYDQSTGQAKLDVWATLTNHSNFDYGAVKLNLIAGEVNTLPRYTPLAYARAEQKAAMAEYASDSAASHSGFAIYHLYDIKEVTNLGPHQTKQIRLAEAGSVPVEKKYIYDARINPRETTVRLVFVNDEKSGLGLPLPAGRVRVFTADVNQALRLAGEDQLDNLPVGQEGEISLGSAFNLTAERIQTEVVRPTKDSRQESYRITLHNSGEEQVRVVIREHLDAGVNWEITQRNHKFTRESASLVEFPVTVPAGQEVNLEYTVRYLYQA